MVKFWKKPELGADIKAYFSHFKKGIFTILGVIVVAGLIVASFVYGDNQRQTVEEVPLVTEETVSDYQDQPTPPQAPTTPASPAPQPAPTPSIASDPQLPSNGPSTVPNTGPEDWAPWVAAIVVVLAWRYRQARQGLQAAQLS